MKRRHASASRRPPSARGTRTSAPTVRVLVSDEKTLDRTGLVAILRSQPDFDVVGEASTAEEAIRVCRDRRPSLIVLALSLPAPEGMTPISAIRAHEPKIPILAVAQRSEGKCLILNPPRSGRAQTADPLERCTAGTDCLELAVAEGAAGTIRRSASPKDLFEAVRTVAAGKAWYEAGTAAAIMRHALACGADDGGRRPLSKREIEVSELIASGHSNKEIARALKISDPTVKKHVGHILAKLQLQDRLQVGIHLTRNPLLLVR